jgi:hypothetical protein
MSTFAQSHAPMVGFRLHMVASLYFEHEAHGRQSAGHCPAIPNAPQYWPTDCPATTVEHGIAHTLQ